MVSHECKSCRVRVHTVFSFCLFLYRSDDEDGGEVQPPYRERRRHALLVLCKGYPGTTPANSSPKATMRRILQRGEDGLVGSQKATMREKAATFRSSRSPARGPVEGSARPGLEQPILPRTCNGLRSIRCPQLAQDIGDMFPRGRKLNHELIGDFLIRGTLSQELQDSLLLCRERFQQWR